MGYVFQPNQSIAVNLNRILSEQLEKALESLENPGQEKEETIHDVRKRIKKIRSLFRLVRSDLKKKDFKRQNKQYRTIAHLISPVRDATVMCKTLEKLQQTYPDRISSSQYAALKKALVNRQHQVSSQFFEVTATLQTVADGLRQAHLKAPELCQRCTGFSVLRPNLKTMYRQARKALQVAARRPSSDHYHELRKEVKTIGYHTRLLEPIWPELLEAYSSELKQLGELLGDDHDCGVLAEEIETGRIALRAKKARETVLQLLDEQRTTLQQQIHPLANRLFAEKAGELVGRYCQYWKLWQTETRYDPALEHLQTV
ncbi:CHAD domain-containing protein [Spirosoma endbachense]|nr:CHAD domain-containing protein [Spirosoma endbachense]